MEYLTSVSESADHMTTSQRVRGSTDHMTYFTECVSESADHMTYLTESVSEPDDHMTYLTESVSELVLVKLSRMR